MSSGYPEASVRSEARTGLGRAFVLGREELLVSAATHHDRDHLALGGGFLRSRVGGDGPDVGLEGQEPSARQDDTAPRHPDQHDLLGDPELRPATNRHLAEPNATGGGDLGRTAMTRRRLSEDPGVAGDHRLRKPSPACPDELENPNHLRRQRDRDHSRTSVHLIHPGDALIAQEPGLRRQVRRRFPPALERARVEPRPRSRAIRTPSLPI